MGRIKGVCVLKYLKDTEIGKIIFVCLFFLVAPFALHNKRESKTLWHFVKISGLLFFIGKTSVSSSQRS